MSTARLAAVAVALALAGSGCAGERPVLSDQPAAADEALDATSRPPISTTSTTTTTRAPTTTTVAAAPGGRVYPVVAEQPAALASRLATVEQLLRADDPAFADLAHEQQMIYRTLGRNPEWLPTVLATVPPDLVETVADHVAARVAIGNIGEGDPPQNVPAWEIIDPLPAAELREIYREAGAATGIDWAYLAAINLLETGYGRIDGLSTAGAQGPMQFLPTTWEEVGEGSIDDPHDAIAGAARYLVRRGGPADMERALWGYNNSDAYVEAVSTYAELFRTDERIFVQTHSWEIHYSAAIGDLWFPVGYRREEPVAAADHVTEAPWSMVSGATDAASIPPPPGG